MSFWEIELLSYRLLYIVAGPMPELCQALPWTEEKEHSIVHNNGMEIDASIQECKAF